MGRKHLPGSYSKAFSWRGEAVSVWEMVQTSTTERNSIVLKDVKPCQNIWQHLEGSCSLKRCLLIL